MEYRLHLTDFFGDALSVLLLIIIAVLGVPFLKILFFTAEKINEHVVQKIVQMTRPHDIIDMSQGGRYDKRLNQQRSTRRPRGF